MIRLPNSSEFSGVRWYQSEDDKSTFFYIPESPSPERSPLGKPTLTLSVADRGGVLQIGTQWGVDNELLEELRQHISKKFPDLPQSSIRLSPAPISVEGVTLAIGNGEGSRKELKTAESSGFPPYSAIFNVQLTDEQKSQAVSALNGRTGFLTVSYNASLLADVSAEAMVTGDVSADIAEVGGNPSLSECEARVEMGLADGRLQLHRSGSEGVPDELRQKVDRLALEKAATLILAMARGTAYSPDQSQLKASASLRERLPVPFTVSTDVGAWFPEGNGKDHILVSSTSVKVDEVTPPTGGAEAVQLGFAAEDLPIAFVQARRGEAKAILRPPSFDPVSLPASQSGGPLEVKTNYTDGGPPFETTLPFDESGKWVLAPEHLGLVQVSVDGSAPNQAGSKRVRVHVRYLPSGAGSADDRTIYLDRDTWTATWFIVTRSAGLGGEIEFEWKETTADGSVVKHPPEKITEPLLKL